MAEDSQLRTLIALGSFSPVGGGGEIPEDLTVCTLTAKTVTVNPDGCAEGGLSVHGSIFAHGPILYEGEVRPAGSGGSVYGASGYFGDIQAQSIGVTAGAEGSGIHFTGAGSSTLTYNCSSKRLEWGGEPVNTTSPIEDLPVTVAPGTFVLKNGKKYQIKADCTSKYPSFNFSNISVEPDATAEIWWKVGTRTIINDIQLPSDWKWVGTELDDCIPANTTLSIAVRKVAGYNGVAGNDVTVANVAYQYTTPAGS